MVHKKMEAAKLTQVQIQDRFFSPMQKLVQEVVIPYQEKVLHDEIPGVEKSHAIENFRIAAGEADGEFYGRVFQDSDVAKWLEAVAYSLAITPDPALEQRADEIIDLIARAQQEDGYLDTYFIIKEQDRRWKNLTDCHEMYCAGHMTEAAVAYYEVTGKDKLLQVMEKCCDHIDRHFGEGKANGIPGHEEIELALLRLYNTTKEQRYLDLAKYFIDERGQDPEFFLKETENRGWSRTGFYEKKTPDYMQCHEPVRDQKEAVGHAVRAVYLYTAMADLAARTNDQTLMDACETLWDNMTEKRMYLTAGIGSTQEGEAFTIDYDLPNDTIYAETCASIGLCFFARQMLEANPNSKYADVMERAFYNGTISGMQLDGKRFFYVNPLEVNPGVSGVLFGHEHVVPERPGWYACACCPPNLARLLTSLGGYAWGESDNTVYSHLFVGGTAALRLATINLESNYPWEGYLKYTVTPNTEKAFSVAIRIPAWCQKAELKLNGKPVDHKSMMKNGYCYLNSIWQAGDTVEVTFAMPVEKIYANENVRADAGCVALMRGPLVYTFESVDNGNQLQALRIKREAKAVALPFEDRLNGIVPVEIEGVRVTTSDRLYSTELPKEEPVTLKAIPYFTWGNRGAGQMRVWLLER